MPKDKLTDILKAIADPTRRKILHILVLSNVLTMQEIYSQFGFTRQAVTKHIHILSEAGLVKIVLKGRERFCYPQSAKLREVYDWVKFYEKFWDAKFISLGNYLRKQ